MTKAKSAEKVVQDIRRKTRRRFSAEEKIRIVLDGLRGEHRRVGQLAFTCDLEELGVRHAPPQGVGEPRRQPEVVQHVGRARLGGEVAGGERASVSQACFCGPGLGRTVWCSSLVEWPVRVREWASRLSRKIPVNPGIKTSDRRH